MKEQFDDKNNREKREQYKSHAPHDDKAAGVVRIERMSPKQRSTSLSMHLIDLEDPDAPESFKFSPR